VKPCKRRAYVKEMKEQSVSERRSCELIGMCRSSYRYHPIGRDHGWLAVRLREIAEEHPTAGYARRGHSPLRRDGYVINHKRIQCTWREVGLTQPAKHKRSKGASVPLKATHKDHVWTYDFVHDRTEDNQALRMLTVEDEYTREGLAVMVRRHMPAKRVQETLAELFRIRGAPEYVRSDNGPELVETELAEWLVEQGVKTHHIDPGSPWQNAYGESLNAILRREHLNRELFHSVLEARIKTQQWLRMYNEKCPHSSLGYLTPVQHRDGVQIPLLVQGCPSCHQRSREIENERQRW